MNQPAALRQILELARWAPSGDNTQPWRFEIVDEHHVVVHGFDTRDRVVYDLTGAPSQISLGALLETIAIASSAHGLATRIYRRTGLPDTRPTFDVHFVRDPDCRRDPLVDCIKKRCVQRRPMSTRPLTGEEKLRLEESVGSAYRVGWLEGWRNRARVASLMFRNAKLRLTMPEAYRVHREVIQWNSQFSPTGIPDQALGVDPLTAKLMRFVLGSWQRVEFFNNYLAGTWAPRIQMDLVPGFACGAHFLIVARQEPSTVDDFIRAGRAVQRFWLTATHLNLFQQPEMTPLIFSSYARAGLKFTASTKLMDMAKEIETRATAVLGQDIANAVWMGRLGFGTAPKSRSTRLSLDQLMYSAAAPGPP